MLLNDDYKVDLINKLPFYHKRIKEFQEINKALTPELEALLIALDYCIDSWYVKTCGEAALSRLEKIASVYPETGENIETRKFRLLNRMNETIPFTDKVLEEKLITLCGEDNYELVIDYLQYKVKVDTTLPIAGSFDILCDTLKNIMPCNILLDAKNTLKELISTITYIGSVCGMAFHYLITHDIEGDYDLGMAFNMGVGMSYGSTGIITHDNTIKPNLRLNINSGTAVGYASTTIIHNS